ncbi:hypothetical protein BGZ95_010091 [Linnemannia exigua]|uniref:Nodulin-like domain-containing protein n=1 Tax=Linnemannia exigua TaxID=604196 RepID=A0AAD4DKK8_9FUNG|nr:hypothetical protein BGZ95_010091 [Linnemannia exigua]
MAISSTNMIRYLSLAIGILVMALSGSLFSFASFSTDLKARFGFSSSNINLLSAIGDTSMYVGFLIVGPIYDHYGERWTMITASVLTFLGYGGMYIAYAKAWGGLGFLMVLYCLAGVASTAGYLAALAANMANFPASTSGTVSGVLLAFFGLSATLFSQIKTHLFSGHDEVVDPTSTLKGTKATQTFLLFLTIITTAIYLIGAVFMVKIKKPVIKTLDSGSSSNATVNITSDIEKRAAATAATPNASAPVQALSRNTTFTPSMKNGREGWNSSSTTLDKESVAPRTAHHLPGDTILESTDPNSNNAAIITTTDPTKTCSCLIGATYGATGALFASMTRDFFGDTYYGTNCGMVMVLNGFNPIIANQIYGIFYDRAVKNQSPTHEAQTEDHMTCLGSACYDSSFKVASLLQVVCVVAAGLLFWAHMRKGRKLMQQNSAMA